MRSSASQSAHTAALSSFSDTIDAVAASDGPSNDGPQAGPFIEALNRIGWQEGSWGGEWGGSGTVSVPVLNLARIDQSIAGLEGVLMVLAAQAKARDLSDFNQQLGGYVEDRLFTAARVLCASAQVEIVNCADMEGMRHVD